MTEVTISESVTRIEYGAFFNCCALQSIVIPRNVTNIGDNVFGGCSNLQKIISYTTLPKVKLMPKLELNSTVTTGGDSTVRYIKTSAFENCPNLKIHYKKGTRVVKLKTHKQVSEIHDDDKVFVIGGTIFVDGTIYLPNDNDEIPIHPSVKKVFLLIPDEGIDITIFRNPYFKKQTTDLEISTDLKKFGDEAFTFCDGFENVKIPEGVEEIGDSAFKDCEILKKIILPGSLNKLGKCAFFNCSSLKRVKFSAKSSLKKFDDETFAGCKSFTRIIIPEGVKILGDNVFSGCTSRQKIFYWAGANFVDELHSGNSAEIIPYYRFKLPDGVTIASDSVFTTDVDYYFAKTILLKNSTGVVDVKIQSGKDKFASNGYTFKFDGVDTFMVFERETAGSEDDPDDNDAVFALLPDLDELNDVELIAYTEVKSLPPPNIIAGGTCGKNITWTLYKDGTFVVSGTDYMYNYFWQVDSQQVNSPWYVNRTLIKSVLIEDGIISIGDHAFYECENLTNVKIPDSVIYISYGAFHGCTNLTSITIPNGVRIIGEYAFFACKNLTSVTIPDSVKKIYADAFCGCNSLTNMTVPASVELFGVYVFGYCDKLENVTFLCNLDKIPDGTFNSCRSLKSVKLPDGITEIAKAAFKSCTSLTNVNIPDDVTIIGHKAFDNCKSLTSVRLPAHVTKIGYGVFNGCKNLEYIEYKSRMPIDNDTFKAKLRDGNNARLIPY